MSELTKSEIVAKFQRAEGDTGSPEVQVALLTARINHLTEHFKVHAKDHHSRRGLLRMVSRRRKLLDYLKRTDLNAYRKLIDTLSLRKKARERFTGPRPADFRQAVVASITPCPIVDEIPLHLQSPSNARCDLSALGNLENPQTAACRRNFLICSNPAVKTGHEDVSERTFFRRKHSR